ncbi:MAG: transglutaminase [Mesorhizobium sp.]|uniref:transglutaminase-like cysteine peptidase n=1 Tax=unclassified Mesorhizobium TaxID=325217 RepID=UPI000F74D3D8|nr:MULTISPECIES: transglutaminase-like cysteine peptidase [unclassified Mesorhizobium]AZO49021.1 transglutaminase [Mesorhizobium sp. M4B.F.Ca.ET.058.02.1.1]RUX50764.1 transglutaminase [Mesorhizobium sp. M4A.F.Ca.ET.050.02.1.1]RVC45295.1 transglutaminase [Mesorhizobium sp. M4A.F.Ca.ET.090.04.2.1]RWC12486.1 MAG: transglutaminase [Mesorhizobium sp.]RWC59517.1 MAG: transglutaminase [Mesorhizobium sp.]
MKTQKALLGKAGLEVLVLAIGLCGMPQPSSASAAPGDSAFTGTLAKVVRAPLSLGGVSLARYQPWQPAASYRIGMVSGAYGFGEVERAEAASAAQGGAGIDPIQTAAIIPGVFGSVALSMRNFPVAARWAPVYRAIVDCSAGSACERKNTSFVAIVDAAKGKGFSDRLAFINTSINRLIAYRKDSAVYGKLDYWAKPSEILERRAGDCEDFAILKMTALLQAGVPAQSMSLVVLQDRKRKFFHAVLSVSTASGAFILDSLGNAVRRDSDLPDYVPLYSFSMDRAWIHGSKTGGAEMADIKGGVAAVAPGEGLEPDMVSAIVAPTRMGPR